MGKSNLLENMAIQDIQNGHGIAFMDPHGSAADRLMDYVPPERVKDVINFSPFDLEHPISFNVLEDVGRDQRHLVSSGLMSAFKKIWVDAWSARMEYILQNTLLALLEYPGATLLGVNRMLSDKSYRQKVVNNVTDPGVKSFWVDEFAKYTERMAAEAVPAIQNKVGQFTSNPLIRNIVGQSRSSLDFRRLMDEKKILIINLSKGRMGESNANLIGSMLITKLYLTAMSRANLSGAELRTLPPFYFFVDEFQSFANESFANILSEARKYKLSLTIAHQYIEQMSEEVRAAVFGNVGSIITFRVGPFDAEVLEKIFFPTFTKEDLVNLGRYQLYLTLMIDGIGSPPFSAVTLPPFPLLQESHRDKIIEHSRQAYAQPRVMVEQEIAKWHSEASFTGVPPTAKPTSPPIFVAKPIFVSPARPAPHYSPTPHPSAPSLRPPVTTETSKLAVSLAALRPMSGSSGRRIVSETEKAKSKEELRRSLEKIMTKAPPPDLGRHASIGSVASKQQPARGPNGEVPREVLEKMLKG